MTGYQHPGYAASLAGFGTPRELPGCGGWILERPVPGSSLRDAIGCYPLFSCRGWERLPGDLDTLRSDLVSLALVADPFGGYRPESLAEWFDVVIPFKEHYVVDMSRPAGANLSAHHRYYARKALRTLAVEVREASAGFAGEWWKLYQNLISRHGIRGIRAFSPESFALQLEVPGMVVFTASEGATLVGAHLWYLRDGVAYSHLAAASGRGYQLSCLYATYACALDYFRDKAQWADLGAGAGTRSKPDGLTAFKAGWATGTRPAHFCGAILNRPAYQELLRTGESRDTIHFPAYRQGEFA